MNKMWNDYPRQQFRPYESLVLATLLCGTATWHMTIANNKKVEAAHRRWKKKLSELDN